jgi:hypothetical protein
MPRKRHKPEEIVAKLRQVDARASWGSVTLAHLCRGRRGSEIRHGFQIGAAGEAGRIFATVAHTGAPRP